MNHQVGALSALKRLQDLLREGAAIFAERVVAELSREEPGGRSSGLLKEVRDVSGLIRVEVSHSRHTLRGLAEWRAAGSTFRVNVPSVAWRLYLAIRSLRSGSTPPLGAGGKRYYPYRKHVARRGDLHARVPASRSPAGLRWGHYPLIVRLRIPPARDQKPCLSSLLRGHPGVPLTSAFPQVIDELAGALEREKRRAHDARIALESAVSSGDVVLPEVIEGLLHPCYSAFVATTESQKAFQSEPPRKDRVCLEAAGLESIIVDGTEGWALGLLGPASTASWAVPSRFARMSGFSRNYELRFVCLISCEERVSRRCYLNSQSRR